MKDLIEKLDRATEPSDDLDWAITQAIEGPHVVRFSSAHLHFTSSIDDALMLVPPHHLWQVKQGIEACAIVWMLETDYDDKPAPTGYSTTFPALALCKAALLAREQLKR